MKMSLLTCPVWMSFFFLTFSNNSNSEASSSDVVTQNPIETVKYIPIMMKDKVYSKMSKQDKRSLLRVKHSLLFSSMSGG